MSNIVMSINPFEERKKLFYKLIRESCEMKKSTLIEMMDVTVDRFQREYLFYLESFNGDIWYNKKTQTFYSIQKRFNGRLTK